MSRKDVNGNDPSRAQRQLLFPSLILLFLSTAFYSHQYFFRVIPGTIQERLVTDFKLSDFELSNVAACFFYAYLIMQPISGIVIAKTSNAFALLLSGASVLTGAMFMSVASVAEHLYISQLLIGIGGSFALIIALNAGSTITKKYYPLLSGGVVAVGASGAIIGQAPFSYLSEAYRWQDIVFYTSFLEMAIILCMVWVLFKHPVLRPSFKAVNKAHVKSSRVKDTLADSNVWLLSLLGCFMCLPLAGFVIVWLYPFISLELGKDTIFSRLAPTMAYGGYIIGSPIVGWAAATFPLRKVQMLIAASVTGFISSMLAIYTIEHSVVVVYILLFVMGVSISSITIIISLIRDWIPSERLPIAIGIAMCSLNIGGTFSLIAIGYILDLEKAISAVPQLEAYHVALVFVPSGFLLAALFSCLALIRSRKIQAMTGESAIDAIS